MPHRFIPGQLKWRILLLMGFVSGLSLDAEPVKLSWTDNSDNEAGFEIERLAEGETFKRIGIVAPNVTEFTDLSADPTIKYTYQVRAFNQFGRSGYSNRAEKLASATQGGEGTSGGASNQPLSHSPLQTISHVEGNNSLPNLVDAADFDFTHNSIAGFSVAPGTTSPILLRMAPSPSSFDRALASWRVCADLEFEGSNRDWRFSDQVIQISETIRHHGLTPPSPFADPAMLIEPSSGQHMAVMKGTVPQNEIEWYEIVSSADEPLAEPDLVNEAIIRSPSIYDLYTIGRIGVEQGGVAITFRVTGSDPQRYTFYAATPQFAIEQEQGALLEPQLNLFSNDTNLQYHSVADFVPLAEDSALPIFPPADETKIAALQVFLQPGIYTAMAFSLSGTGENGILALSIQN